MKLYFEWDEAKNQKNHKKHDVSFETASLIFDEDDCEIVRIISARQVTKAERNQYEYG